MARKKKRKHLKLLQVNFWTLPQEFVQAHYFSIETVRWKWKTPIWWVVISTFVVYFEDGWNHVSSDRDFRLPPTSLLMWKKWCAKTWPYNSRDVNYAKYTVSHENSASMNTVFGRNLTSIHPVAHCCSAQTQIQRHGNVDCASRDIWPKFQCVAATTSRVQPCLPEHSFGRYVQELCPVCRSPVPIPHKSMFVCQRGCSSCGSYDTVPACPSSSSAVVSTGVGLQHDHGWCFLI